VPEDFSTGVFVRETLPASLQQAWPSRIFIQRHYMLWLSSSALRVAKHHVLPSRCSELCAFLDISFREDPFSVRECIELSGRFEEVFQRSLMWPRGQKIKKALPSMFSKGTGPKKRESREAARLSPITNTSPLDTITGPKELLSGNRWLT
jgi:hypothetical protein